MKIYGGFYAQEFEFYKLLTWSRKHRDARVMSPLAHIDPILPVATDCFTAGGPPDFSN
jgi:hypothetical protein